MKSNILIIIFLFVGSSLMAQDVNAKLDEAKVAYNSGNHEDARFALQQSLAELDKIVGAEILKLLPEELGGIDADIENDNVTGGMGFTGVYVDRQYTQESLYISIQIITDSPFLAMVNTALTNPLLASMGDGSQKVIKLDGYKALMESEEDVESPIYKFQIPVSNSLITIETEGYSDDEALEIANALDYRSIVSLIGSGQ